jgi:hypothetical protein
LVLTLPTLVVTVSVTVTIGWYTVPLCTLELITPPNTPAEDTLSPFGKPAPLNLILAPTVAPTRVKVTGSVAPGAADGRSVDVLIPNGGTLTVRVKLWVAGDATPLEAVMVLVNVPAAVGVPESTPVVASRVSPSRGPGSMKVGAGVPEAVTVNVPARPAVSEVLLAEVMVGAVPDGFTVSVKAWVAGDPTPLEAVMAIGKTPAWVGMPESTPAADRTTPEDNEPDSLKVGAGLPVAATVNVPGEPWRKLVPVAEVMVGALVAGLTVSVKLWVAAVPIPLPAVIVLVKTPVAVGVPVRAPEVALSDRPSIEPAVTL